MTAAVSANKHGRHGGRAAEMYPGSALQVMTALGDDCSYLFCDLDPHTAADLRHRLPKAVGR
jgi:hypothetical protein